jgi:hypothetical protein
MRCIMQPVLMCCLRGVSPLAVSRRAWIEANRLIRKRALGPAFENRHSRFLGGDSGVGSLLGLGWGWAQFRAVLPCFAAPGWGWVL